MLIPHLFYIIAYPGVPVANLVSKLRTIGDGTDNESQGIEYQLWSFGFGLVFWIFFLIFGTWLIGHLNVSFKP